MSFSCLHWIKKPNELINIFYDYLKKDGELLILTYPKESPYYKYLEGALENYPEFKPSANATMLSTASYKQLFQNGKFELIEFKEQLLTANYNSFDEVINFVKGWLNNYVSLPKKVHKSFFQDLKKEIYKEESLTKGNIIMTPFSSLAIRAKKILGVIKKL